MKISTDNPNECHDLMYAALDRYKRLHQGDFILTVKLPGGKNIYTCTYCKAELEIKRSTDGLIKSFFFNKHYCDKMIDMDNETGL